MDSSITWSILCCALFLSSTEAELYTAISDVEPLLETHKLIIHNIDNYLNKEENRINILKQHLNHYKKEHEKAIEDIPNYLGNPINAFTLIKRLTTDLIHFERRIKMGIEYINNVSISQLDQKYPEYEDLMGAAQALTRLQEVYYLSVEDLSEGILNGVTYSTSMTSSDCIEVGRALYNQKDFTNAIAWMKAALRKFHENNLDYPVEEDDVLEYIGYFYYEQGDVKKALEWTEKLLQLNPDHVNAKDNVLYYKNIIRDNEEKLKKKKRGEPGDDDEVDPENNEAPDALYAQELKSYESLCRGETDVPREIAQRLKCYYLTENHPFLRLAPIKAEQVYINPDMVVFHQVISDDEIKFVQNAAKPKFVRSGVNDPTTGEPVVVQYRISKTAGIRDEESPVIAKITQRVADMTGLNMWSAECLEVANYGIGGHYVPHYDFTRKHEPTLDMETVFGNRIATVLFYMSEVSQGGATVFTHLGLSIGPIKNAAVFWMNLHPSGEGDLDMRHAACPVLRGSKWICTKWIHQGGQELLKPCNLEYQQENTLRKIPRAVPKSLW